jgi:hypothetical protein
MQAKSQRFVAAAAVIAAVLVAARLANPGRRPPVNAVATEKTGRLVCDKSDYDFGRADSAQMIEHAFIVGNAGGAPLRITRVRPSCGCTIADAPDRLAPGAQGVVDVKLSLAGKEGAVAESVAIECDDESREAIRLSLSGTAVVSVRITPEQVAFGRLATNAAQTRWVRVEFAGPTNIRKVGCDLPQVAVKTQTLEPGKAYQISVGTLPPLAAGRMAGALTIETDDPGRLVIKVPVSASVSDYAVVAPPQIIIRESSTGGATTAHLFVALAPGAQEQLRILSVTAPIDAIKAQISPVAGGGCQITLTGIVPDKRLDGRFLRIQTNVKGVEEILVPFRVDSGPAAASRP